MKQLNVPKRHRLIKPTHFINKTSFDVLQSTSTAYITSEVEDGENCCDNSANEIDLFPLSSSEPELDQLYLINDTIASRDRIIGTNEIFVT